MGTLLKYVVGGLLLVSGFQTMHDGVDVVCNGEDSRIGKLFRKKKSTVSVDTVDFESSKVEDE